MVDQLMVFGLLVCGVAFALTTFVSVVGAAIYDLQAARQRHQRRIHPHARRYRQRPLVTVLVMAHDAEKTITDCLDSLRLSSYRKLQIIVVDTASGDATKALVKAYMAEYTKLNLRLVAKRQVLAWAAAARDVYKTYGDGELVMLLNADSRVARHTLRRLVDYTNDRPDVSVLTPRLQPVAAGSLGDLLQIYLGLLGQRSAKAASIIHTRRVINSNGVCYQRKAFSLLLGPLVRTRPDALEQTMTVVLPAAYKTAYTDDVIVKQMVPRSYYQLCREGSRLQALKKNRQAARTVWLAAILALCRVLMVFLLPLLSSYFIFLALRLQEPLFLILTMAALSLLLLFAIWEDGQLAFRQRLAYSLSIPITYSLFYLLAWIRLLTACWTWVWVQGRQPLYGRILPKSF